MEHFAKSWFWRIVAVSVVGALAYFGWAVAGERTILPVAQAGGVYAHPATGQVYTTSQAGDVLYVWPLAGAGRSGHLERWSFRDGSVTYKALTTYTPIVPGQPGVPGGAIYPGQPGIPIGPIYPGQPLPPSPQPGSGR